MQQALIILGTLAHFFDGQYGYEKKESITGRK